MTPNKQQAIYNAFPHLFRQGIEGVGLMKYGLCVGDGWFKLIFELCEAIMDECQRLGLKPGELGFPVVVQVKEKFGALRFYLHKTAPPDPEYTESEVEDIRRGSGPGHDKMERYEQPKPALNLESVYDLVHEAGRLSETICEQCGEPGGLSRYGGWIQIRCEQCSKKEQKERNGL